MKILVLSDIHANIWALNTVLAAEPEYDLLCFAGDVIDCGIAPCPVISTLKKAEKAVLVYGNHDYHAMRLYRSEDFRINPQKYYFWTVQNLEQITEEQAQFIENLPAHQYFMADGWAYLLKHQFIFDTYEIIDSRAKFETFWREHTPEEYWDAPKKRIIFGHTHRPAIYTLDEGMEWINPGSVSYRKPDDPEKTAHYMIIRNGTVEMKKIPYDRTPLLKETLTQYKNGNCDGPAVQDFLFFFGDAKTTRAPLPAREEITL